MRNKIAIKLSGFSRSLSVNGHISVSFGDGSLLWTKKPVETKRETNKPKKNEIGITAASLLALIQLQTIAGTRAVDSVKEAFEIKHTHVEEITFCL